MAIIHVKKFVLSPYFLFFFVFIYSITILFFIHLFTQMAASSVGLQ